MICCPVEHLKTLLVYFSSRDTLVDSFLLKPLFFLHINIFYTGFKLWFKLSFPLAGPEPPLPHDVPAGGGGEPGRLPVHPRPLLLPPTLYTRFNKIVFFKFIQALHNYQQYAGYEF